MLKYLFIALSLANLAFIAAQWQPGVQFTKPLLMLSLAAWFYQETKEKQHQFTWLIIAGLLFSMLGDTLLMFIKTEGMRFFTYGLGSFLVAHLFYIAAFVKYPDLKKGLVQKRPLMALPFVAYLILLLIWLWPGLPDALLVPVVVYAFVITSMAVCCLNMRGRAGELAFQTLMIGALLFVLSDTILALDTFRRVNFPQPLAGLMIMVTYLGGQYLLAKGSILANEERTKPVIWR